ncbi:uncharacterized protein HD556DRAFT_1309238 [Suillus plorans]|uniref:CxC2-like cysteine cluster KDZ transposase-associated domain-containing protein n=1 Tax=Suillus plorans TaxID=116603 RepID=A0A9P7DG14_9AGAM|nr:uncharacterized protein HD556DRAFT_1309238 [Suillus plorans]KAG1792709.1 hypothetical protein HD556DRAFT_1309238 [Suillus plorans]
MVIWLGHEGNACPWDDDVGESALFTTGEGDSNDTDAESTLNEPNAEQSTKEAHDLPTGVLFIKNNKAMITIVDKSGVHTHIIKYCTCPEADTADIQLFNMEPKTAFTFDVLNDFSLDNLECGTLAMNYYSKLRRMTTSVFPHLVLDHYWELMRVARQWQKLKLLKWNGFGHEEKEVRPGNLALFFPACPQLGINVTLPARGTTEDINANNGSGQETLSLLYIRSLVMDRNFKAKHLHATNPADEVSLMNGRGFMVGNALYKEHLAIAKDAMQRSECNNHHAVNLANASHHRLEATSIGRCASARHGCFVPHAMVDFQKGERCVQSLRLCALSPTINRQMNMDYALCEALKLNTKGIRCVLTFYDVNCQYHKHLQDRITDSPLLKMHDELEITPGIGLWHIHGHQDSCYVRYASNFIQGAARIDGKIIETLWVLLNIISLAACGMGTPHRKECLDYQMNDCNFMKMIRMIKDWEAQERLAHEQWRHDPIAMDIYEVQLQQSADQKTARVKVVNWHKAGGLASDWLIGHRRDTLQWDIDRWTAARAIILSEDLGDNDMQIMQPDLLILQEDAEEDMDTKLRAFEPEKGVIPLPSNLGLEKCAALSIADIADQELTLWQGQANDALHHIRVHLADKVVIFRKTVRVAKSQVLSTRAWAQVHSVDRAVSINASIYSKCRSQLCRLSTDDALLKRYQLLTREHLKVSTAIADPNSRGQRNNVLAWFWSLDVEGDSDSSDWLNECAISKLAQKHGHVAYSERQCKIYQRLFGEARDSFNRANGCMAAGVTH